MSSPPAEQVTGGAARPRHLIPVLGLLSAVGAMSIDLYLPAVPQMAAHFGVRDGRLQLTLSATLFGLAVGQLLYGSLSDRFGRRTPLLWGMGLFTVTSLICAVAPNLEVLVGLRFVQAVGGCAGLVLSRAIVRDVFSGAAAAKALSAILLVFGVVPVLAPLAGGQLLRLGWPSIFVTLGGFGLACMAGAWSLPETLAPHHRHHGSGRSWLGVFARLVTDRAVAPFAVIGGLGQASMFSYIAMSPLVVIGVFGVPSDRFGLVFGVNALALVLTAQVNARLLDRYDTLTLLRVAVLVQLAGGISLVVLGVTRVGGLAAVMAAMVLTVGAVGAINPNATGLTLEPYPRRAGAAAALLGGLQMAIGGIMTTALGLLGGDPLLRMAVAVLLTSAGAALIVSVVTARARREVAVPAAVRSSGVPT